MAKLDAELRVLLSRKQFFDRHPEAGRLSIGPSDPLYIALKFHGDIRALVDAGLILGSKLGPFAFGQTTLAGLEALASHPQVESMSRQRRGALQLDDSIPDIHANQVWSRSGDNFTGYTGRGVLVGVIDTGIDFRHKAFRHADGKTRIHKIWDQTLTGVGAETVPGEITEADIAESETLLGYGVEYDDDQINDTLTGAANPVRVRHVDKDGHGTHVAGIAAGDGSQNGHCHGAYHYVGVATEADLLVVRLWGMTEGDSNVPSTTNPVSVDAIRWVMNEARLAGKPVVVNMSFGAFTEAMDGGSEIAQAIDFLLIHNPRGHAVVVAAGNDADAGFHAAATVPAGPTATLDLKFEIHKKDKKSRHAVVLYTGTNLQARLTSPVGGSDGEIDWIDSTFEAAHSTTANGSGTGAMATLLVEEDRIVVSITPATGGSNKRGTWTLQLRDGGSTPTATPIDALLTFGSSHDDKSPKFESHTTSRSTLLREATGFESIAVGSYKVGGKLSGFSARGPTLNRPTGRPKPDLAAPGENIASAAIAKERNCERCCCNCCLDFYVTKDGTSMAAPHVAGVVALMLHKDPNLNRTDIRNLLSNNTSPKGDSSADQDLGWGGGRLDAKKVMDKVTQVNPPVTRTALADDPLTQLHERVLATDRGPQLQRLFDRYANEVWTLIQNNRRVATVWHRCGGPIWVRLALRAAHVPEADVPAEVDGLSLQDGARRFAAALARYGSPELRRDLLALAPDIRRIKGGVSLSELIDDLGNRVSQTPQVEAAPA